MYVFAMMILVTKMFFQRRKFIKYSSNWHYYSLCDMKEKKLMSSLIRHWIYCTSKGLHALGRVIVNKINLQINKNTILIQSSKMLITSHYFLWITSDSHNQLIIQSTEMTRHRGSFTLVWVTAQDWGLRCLNAYQHIDSTVSLWEQRSFVLKCFWGTRHG